MSARPSGSAARRRTAGALLAIACLVTLIPFAWLAVSSLKTNEDFLGSMFVPKDESGRIALERLTGEHYVKLFRSLGFLRPLVNSVFLSSVTGLIATLFC